MAYTDNQNITATIASTSESTVGSLNISAGQSYTLTSLWAGHANGKGGTYRIAVDTYPQANFAYVVNGQDSQFEANEPAYPVNIRINGPAELTAYMTCADATSGIGRVSIGYINSEGPTN